KVDAAAAEAPGTIIAGAEDAVLATAAPAAPAVSATAAATTAPVAVFLSSNASLAPGGNDGAEKDVSSLSPALVAAMAAAADIGGNLAAAAAIGLDSAQVRTTPSTTIFPPSPFSGNRASSPAPSIDSTDAALNVSDARLDAALSAASLARQVSGSGHTPMQADSTINEP
ncbi:unnamed protein product, partial [Tilletia caries]